MTRHIDCARCGRGVHKASRILFSPRDPSPSVPLVCTCFLHDPAVYVPRWILTHCNCIISADESRTERYASRLRRRLVEVIQPRQILDNHFGQGWAHCLISIAGKRSDGVSASYRFQSQKPVAETQDYGIATVYWLAGAVLINERPFEVKRAELGSS